MTDEMKKTLGEFMAAMLDIAKNGADFAQQQIPLLLQEKLTFDFWAAFVWVFFWGVPCIIAIYLSKWLYTTADNFTSSYQFDDGERRITAWVVGLLSSAALVATIAVNSFTMIKIMVAPRIYIIDWLMEAAKK